MTDYFALFEEARRPWIESESLKEKFICLSTELHPDRVHGASTEEKNAAQKCFTELNVAYNVLRDPKDRIGHLLELECGSKPGQIDTVPASTADLFLQISQLLREVDGFLANGKKQTSPLLKARFFEDGMNWMARLDAVQQNIACQQRDLGNRLRNLNPVWENAPQIGSIDRRQFLPISELKEIYRTFGFLNRWSAQIQERIVELSF